MNGKIVTLAGATGYLGQKIARELIKQGAHVRAMVRATSNTEALEKIGVTEFVTGDMMDLDSLKTALSQNPRADVLIASAAGYTGHTKGDTPMYPALNWE
jgi:nucleoside-diphosphate-sugar epimerase